MLFHLRLAQGFCQQVSFHELSRAKLEFNCFIFHSFPNNVSFHIDVFRSLLRHMILAQHDTDLVVLLDDSWFVDNYAHLIEKWSQISSLLNCCCHCLLISHNGGYGFSWFLFGALTNYRPWLLQMKAVASSWPSTIRKSSPVIICWSIEFCTTSVLSVEQLQIFGSLQATKNTLCSNSVHPSWITRKRDTLARNQA